MAYTKVTGALVGSLSDLDLTNVGDIQLDSISGDGDTNTSITFSGSDVITIATGGSGRLTIGDGALSPVTDNQIDLGTSSLEFKDGFFDGTVTADAFAGPITGDLTGTLQTAAQTNITSLGTLTALTGGTGDLVWDTTTLVVDSSDNSVGMGTASPSSYNSNTRNLVIRDSGSGGITISTGASNTGYIAFNDGEDTTIEGLIAYNQDGDIMSFRTASTDNRLVIDGSGRVGINRTPAIANAKLEVGGADNVPLINVEASGVTGGMGVGATGLQLFHGSTSRMKITSDGVVNMTNQARMIRSLSSAQSIANSTTTTIDWANNESTVGITYSSGEFTIVEAGVYVVHAYARFQSASTGHNQFLSLHHKASGGSYAEIAYDYVLSCRGYHQMNINRAKLCAAGDVMRIRVNHNQGSSMDLTGNSASCAISVTKVA